MTPLSPTALTSIRSFQYRDLESIAYLGIKPTPNSTIGISKQLPPIMGWYGLIKILSFFPNPGQYLFHSYVAEADRQIKGMIQVAPCNWTRSTWRVERVACLENYQEIGSQLLRHCFEKIWEARTWVIEVNVNDNDGIALYRHNGFQPLAQMTYWSISSEQLQDLAIAEPDLPNLQPVSNADAQLLYQLDTVSMPPLLRQVFDRHILDFKASFLGAIFAAIKQWLNRTENISGYVFEPQRKAAIGYFSLQLCRDGQQPHIAQLTVHPAYTWLYPEMLCQMARLAQEYPPQTLQLASADYQPEREAYLLQIGAERIEHTLLMSRSVWHKLRESKSSVIADLQLSDVLQGLQPARKPAPSRMSWLGPMQSEGLTNIRPNDDNHLDNNKDITNLDSKSPLSSDPDSLNLD